MVTEADQLHQSPDVYHSVDCIESSGKFSFLSTSRVSSGFVSSHSNT